MEKKVELSGALRVGVAQVKDVLAELENGQALERAGFAQLVRGSTLSLDDLMRRVLASRWYLDAGEALRLRLIAGIV